MQDSLQDAADLLMHSASEDFAQQTTPELSSNVLNTNDDHYARQQRDIIQR